MLKYYATAETEILAGKKEMLLMRGFDFIYSRIST